METIRKVIDKIDVNVSGGRRVFIYYAENAKAKDLGATLNAIYTGRETTATTSSLTSTGGSQVRPGPGPAAAAASPAAVGRARRAAGNRRRAAGRGPDSLHRGRDDQRDHRHDHAAAVGGHRGHHQAARPHAAPGADRGAGGRDRADQRSAARRGLGAEVGKLPVRAVVAQRRRLGRSHPRLLSAHPDGGQARPSGRGRSHGLRVLRRRVSRAAEYPGRREPREHRVEPPRDDLGEQEGGHQRVAVGARRHRPANGNHGHEHHHQRNRDEPLDHDAHRQPEPDGRVPRRRCRSSP